jgi:hypothetical protein
MPIAPELRARFYGRDWRRYRARLIAIRGARCAACGRDTPRYLNAAHTTHDPVTSSIKLMCAGCHARHDAPRRIATVRRRRAARFGQLWLMPELEYAAAPAWAIPRAYFEALQERLF